MPGICSGQRMLGTDLCDLSSIHQYNLIHKIRLLTHERPALSCKAGESCYAILINF